MDKACGTCRWWNDTSRDEWSGYAACHRYPPTNKEHSRGGPVSVWPQTSRHDFCGEHQPKENPNG